MRPKSRMLAKLHHIPKFMFFINFSRIFFFVCGIRGSANFLIPDYIFLFLVVFPLGKYFVPDLNRASQA